MGNISTLSRCLVIATTALILSSCAAVPLKTALKLRKLDTHALTSLNPADLPIKVTLDNDVGLLLDHTRLNLNLTRDGREWRSTDIHLSLLGRSLDEHSAGLFRAAVPVSIWHLELSEKGLDQFRKAQEFMLTGEPDGGEFGIAVAYKLPSDEIGSFTVKADLRLYADEPFMPLIKRQTIKVVPAATDESTTP